MIKTKRVKVGKLEVSYLHTENVQNFDSALIFVHGFPFNNELWRNQLTVLPNRIQGIAYDIRGFGQSSGGHHFYSIDLFAKDLIALLDHLSISKAIICGISMGGYIALRTYQLSPERINGLILADTNAVADADETKLKRFNSIEQVLDNGKAVFANEFLKNVFSERSFTENPVAIQGVKEMILNTSESTICSTLLALASRTDISEFLPEIKVPTLIIRGAEDKLMTDAQALQLHSGISSSEYEAIPGSGHLPNLENPSVFNQYLLNFINKHF